MAVSIIRRILMGGLFLCLAGATASFVAGQDKPKGARKVPPKAGRTKPIANTRTLDQRAETLTTSFVKEAESLADEYFDSGHPEKSLAVLQRVLALNPNEASIKKKIEQITDHTLSANEFVIDVNAASGWEACGVQVTEGKPVRISADGSYKFEMGGSLGPAGLVEKDVTKDLVTGIPTGALMGIVQLANSKAGKPFLIGSGTDFTPKETGKLLMKINAPQGHRCTGKIKVTVSGAVTAG